MRKLFFITIVSLSIFSCKKDPSVSSGDSSISYSTDEYITLVATPHFSGTGSTARLVVDNTDIYRDMVGVIMTDAAKAMIDGKPAKISNLEIKGINLKLVEISDSDNFLSTNLNDCLVELVRYDASGVATTQSLGDLLGVSNGTVSFDETEDQFSNLKNETPDKIVFTFDLDEMPETNFEVKYNILFNFQYTYDMWKQK